MSSRFFALFFLISFLATLSADGRTPGWDEDYDKVTEKAARDGKMILVWFDLLLTGSGGFNLPVSRELEKYQPKEQFRSANFKRIARQHLELVQLTAYMGKNSPLNKKEEQAIEQLRTQLSADKLPTVILLTSNRTEVARWTGVSRIDLVAEIEAAILKVAPPAPPTTK